MLGAVFEPVQYLRGVGGVGVMAGLGVQEKISKINAELARLELEMELDHGGGQTIGMKLPQWLVGKTRPDAAGISADVSAFETLVLLEVSGILKIAADKAALDVLKINPTDASYSSRLPSGGGANVPDCAWKFKYNKKDLFIFFWAGSSSSYSVFEDASGSVKFDFDKMSLSQVWGDYTKKAGKKYRFVKAHLHADILTASGEWAYQ